MGTEHGLVLRSGRMLCPFGSVWVRLGPLDPLVFNSLIHIRRDSR